MLTVRDGQRYIVESGEPLSAFLELEATLLQLQRQFTRQKAADLSKSSLRLNKI